MDAKSSYGVAPEPSGFQGAQANNDRNKFHQAGSASELDAEDKFVIFERWLYRHVCVCVYAPPNLYTHTHTHAP
jgi:hypothetical protein